jgi:hypothetical protein
MPVELILSDMLCVPSTKTEITPDVIDHYLVYEVLTPMPSGLQADMLDQFGDSQAILWERDKFANPVDKTHPPELPDPQNIINPDEHLSWWRFEAPVPHSGKVLVGNQFGPDQRWCLGDAEYLLVPAIKDQIGEITWNQHYECYAALNAPDIGVQVSLYDQFGLWPNVNVLGGRYLCNPVEKLGPLPLVPSGPPIFPEEHLACYDIAGWPIDEIRLVQDQVDLSGGFPVELIQARMLCVPSTKSIIPDPIPSLAPWGIATLGGLMLLAVFGVARQRGKHAEPA